jgi:anti-sigma regulatory factor (Ser/Thr protein kinase)
MPVVDDALRHNAFVYATEDDYLSVAVAFLLEGLELGQGAVVANTRPGIVAMRSALGSQASDVTFVDVSEAYTRPAKTLAAYHRVYAQELGRFDSLRAVADVQFGPDPGEWELWTGYEAVFNRSFAHLPAWVLCSYKASELADPMREGIWRTHPEVVSDGAWTPSAAYDHLNPPPPSMRGRETLADTQEIVFTGNLDTFREALAGDMRGRGLPAAKTLEVVVAVGEIVTNALAHGGGVRAVRTGRLGDRCVCEVVDTGAGFDDPLAGYLAPRPGRGSGLWVARQLAWDLDFFRAPDGFTARLTA